MIEIIRYPENDKYTRLKLHFTCPTCGTIFSADKCDYKAHELTIDEREQIHDWTSRHLYETTCPICGESFAAGDKDVEVYICHYGHYGNHYYEDKKL